MKNEKTQKEISNKWDGCFLIQLSKKKKGGFSLIEVLVALVVLSVGMVSVVVLMTGNIKTSVNAKNQIIASQLAQEGIELVRNLRDNNAAFKSSPPGKTTGDYRIDTTTTYAGFDISANYGLYLPAAGGFYTHTATGGTLTKFYRKVNVTNGSGQITVTVSVIWSGTSFPTTCNTANKCTSIVAVLPDAS